MPEYRPRVEFVDQDVADGGAASRADATARTLAREQRRRAAERTGTAWV
jgi:hypothetical protein